MRPLLRLPRLLLTALLFATLGTPVFAGGLGDFEDDASRRRPETSKPSPNPLKTTATIATITTTAFSWMPRKRPPGICWRGACAWPVLDWRRGYAQLGPGGPGTGEAAKPLEVQPEPPGEALIPFARRDLSCQNVENNVDDWDTRLEGGYGPFGAQLGWTRYLEYATDDDLSLLEGHALYRMSMGDHVEWDLELSFMQIKGDTSHTGWSFTSPLLVHPWEFAGLEYRPTWGWINGNTISDHDLALTAGWRHIPLRVGSRWLHSPREPLDVPYIGLSHRY